MRRRYPAAAPFAPAPWVRQILSTLLERALARGAHWQAEVRLVQQQIQDGAIGSVISVRANFYGGTGGFEAGTWRSQIEGDGGIVVDGGTHYVRPLRYALRARYPAATAASQKLVRRALTRTGCTRSGCGCGVCRMLRAEGPPPLAGRPPPRVFRRPSGG